jgi:uncharacterized membrane protein YphA (DoxX/SURF4 family)
MQTTKESIPQSIITPLALFWIVAKLYSYKAWGAERVFALVPVAKFLHLIPYWVHGILYAISILFLFGLLIKPKQYYLLSIAIIEILSCLLDCNRWQPWEYQYILMALVCWNYYYKKEKLTTLILFILGTIYLFSGLHKLSSLYVNYFWANTIIKKIFHLPQQHRFYSLLLQFGYVPVLLEALSGLALLVGYKSKWAARYLIILHCLIIIVLSPIGISYNYVVLPWNMAMICFLYQLVIKQEINKKLAYNLNWLNIFVYVLMGLMPILSFFNRWDYYLSSCLYSAKPPTVTIKTKRPPAYFINKKLAFKKTNDSLYTIYVQSWAIKEMGIPPYPEKRVLKKIIDYSINTFHLKPEEFILKEIK